MSPFKINTGSCRSFFIFIFRSLCYGVLLAIVVQSLFFQSFRIGSPTMENTFSIGDFVLVSKFEHGVRLPITPLSIPFIANTIPLTHIKSYSTAIELPPLRLPGILRIKQNDLIVFNSIKDSDLPLDKRSLELRRCIAIPADTVQYKNGNWFINNQTLQLPPNMRISCQLFDPTHQADSASLAKYGITHEKYDSLRNCYITALSHRNLDKLRADSLFRHIEINRTANNTTCNYTTIEKSLIESQKFVVPKKGRAIELNLKNIALYKYIILHTERKKLELTNNQIFIDGNKTDFYIFENNYYLALCDNIELNPEIYFVPDKNIIGKAKFVWFSTF